jgi:predicted dehydrogenase
LWLIKPQSYSLDNVNYLCYTYKTARKKSRFNHATFVYIYTLVAFYENFRDKLLGKEADIVTLAEGIETVRVADAAIQSSKIGQSIKL